MKTKIPYGISNFERIATQDYLFVDKTHFIEALEQIGTKYHCFFRPRRFGKSLFISLLEHYYDLFYQERFDALFGNLYIGKNPTKLKNNFGILKFDFSGIETSDEERTRNGFLRKVFSGIHSFNSHHSIMKRQELEKLEAIREPGGMMEAFLKISEERFDQNLYILIDEYDHFANELLAFDLDRFKKVMMGQGFVRKFYEVIKSGSTSTVDRVFITGVTPLTLDSLTSGFNIDANLTNDLRFHDMLGFTETEVVDATKTSLSHCRLDVTEFLETMRFYYNGYQFHEEAQARLYNPDMILYYLKEYAPFCKSPKNLLDINIASDYGKLKRIFEIGDQKRNFDILKRISEGNDVRSTLVLRYDLEFREFDEADFISLLFYMGLLTIQSPRASMLEFGIPNYVIKKLYFELFLNELFKRANLSTRSLTLNIENAIYELGFHENFSPILGLIETCFQNISNRDFLKFDEKYVKLTFLIYLSLSNIYIVKSEYEIGKGYADIVLLKNPAFSPPHEFMIEIKYLKKSDATKKRIEQKVKEGKEQIKRYKESVEGQKRKDLKGYVLLFVGEKCKRVESGER